MGVGKDEDDLDLASEDPNLWVEEGREVSEICDKIYYIMTIISTTDTMTTQVSKEEMVVCKRVNVTSATPFRWYIR